MRKTMDLVSNWTIRKADIWRVGKLVKDFLEITNPLIDIVELIQKGDLDKVTSYVMSQHNDLIVSETHNIIPEILRFDLAKRIGGLPTLSTLEAKYIALGNDPTPPAPGDVKLGNETIRSLFTNRYTVDNVVYLDKFFSSADVSGNTYLEAGIFCDGSMTPDSGFLLSKISMNETISANEVLTINCSITINSIT